MWTSFLSKSWLVHSFNSGRLGSQQTTGDSETSEIVVKMERKPAVAGPRTPLLVPCRDDRSVKFMLPRIFINGMTDLFWTQLECIGMPQNCFLFEHLHNLLFFHGKTNGFLVDYLQVVCGLRPLAEFIPGQFRSDLLGFWWFSSVAMFHHARHRSFVRRISLQLQLWHKSDRGAED